jgi:broad specificity phosphatase PhoE
VTRLLLIRHGQSVWNAQGRWQGQANPPLTSLGHDQAAAAGTNLTDIEVLAASDLVRARQTATAIGTVTGINDLTVDARLRERHAGEWQGLTRPEIDDLYPGYLDDGRRPEGWESNADLHDRAVAALLDLAAIHQAATVGVVTHGGVTYSIEESHGEPHRRISNLGGRWLNIDDGAITLGDRVDLLGDLVEASVPDQI